MPDIAEVIRRNLTPDQRDAALDSSREILTLACAGSGKSRTLAYRIARLIAEGNQPDSIVAFTFTEKAAETIKRRVSSALIAAGIDPTIMGRMFIGTIHSYCQRVLMKMNAIYRQFDVLDENRLVLYLISRYYQLGLQTFQQRYFETIKQIAKAWKTANDELVRLEDVVDANPGLGAVLVALRDNLERDQFLAGC